MNNNWHYNQRFERDPRLERFDREQRERRDDSEREPGFSRPSRFNRESASERRPFRGTGTRIDEGNYREEQHRRRDDRPNRFEEMPFRYLLRLEYDGSRFSGWQAQRGLKTVLGSLLEACREGLRPDARFEVYGAGRTDAGVHALEQVAHLALNYEEDCLRLKHALNDHLPADVNILRVEPADQRFHARYDAKARSYVYVISKRRSCFNKNRSWWIKDNLNGEVMARAAGLLEGRHDFGAFTDWGTESESTIVELSFIDVHETDDTLNIHIVASHFLWKMVRRIVGVLVEAGRGNLTEDDIRGMLKAGRSPLPAQYTAPASGLYLEHVYYEGEPIRRGREVIPALTGLN